VPRLVDQDDREDRDEEGRDRERAHVGAPIVPR
jgi:hypothetical protein